MEQVKDIKSVIAENISRYRKAANMTQQDLANAINYSDKSISKWERGEAVPDIYILKEIADLFNITVNDLLNDSPRKIRIPNPFKLKNHILITLMAVLLAWLVAVIVVVVLKLIDIKAFDVNNVFLYAIPVSFIILIVFNAIWFKKRLCEEIYVSILSWSILGCAFSTITPFLDHFELIFYIGIPFQLLIILWYLMDKRKR